MTPAIRRLVLIDTASRLATRILNGRKTTCVMTISPATEPGQIETVRTQETGAYAFERMAAELQLRDIK